MTTAAALPPTAPERLRELAQQVRSLVPDRRDPERFHRDKDVVEKELRRIAAEIEQAR